MAQMAESPSQDPRTPIAAEPLQYVTVDREGPPGLVTAIGVCSIIIAGISVLFSAMVALQGLAYFVMSLVGPGGARAGARGRWRRRERRGRCRRGRLSSGRRRRSAHAGWRRPSGPPPSRR